MVDVTTRAAKGSALTFEELDANWTNLKNAIESIPAGAAGASAYDIAVDNGFEGTEEEWLASLVGADGADGTNGTNGTNGTDGASAYQIALDNGFVGTEAVWLASLQGADGADGADGAAAGVGQYVTTIGNGTDTTFTITHNLGTKNVSIAVYPNAGALGEVYTKFSNSTSTIYNAFDTATYGKKIEVQIPFSSGDYLQTDNSVTFSAGIYNNGTSAFISALPTDGVTVQIIGGGVGSAEYEALKAEVETARGDRSNLNNRITTISNFASPNAGGVVVGNYYDNAFQGTASTTLAGATNRVVMAPFYTSAPLRIDQLGIAISTAVTSSSLKCFIYGSDADGWPDELLYEGSSDLSGATTGYKSHSLDFTFDSGRQYWLGVKMNSTATYRAINVSSAVNLGLSGSNATSYYTVVTRTLTYANALPDPWVFTSSDLAASSPPSIRMRAAALP